MLYMHNIIRRVGTAMTMAARPTRQAIIILQLWFLSFFSSPILSGRRLDVYHTSIHDVALVQI